MPARVIRRPVHGETETGRRRPVGEPPEFGVPANPKPKLNGRKPGRKRGSREGDLDAYRGESMSEDGR